MNIDHLNWWLMAGLFFGYMLVDGLYAYYTMAVVQKRAMSAATSSLVIHLIYAVGVLSYMDNLVYVVPLAVGSFVGTYVVTKRAK